MSRVQGLRVQVCGVGNGFRCMMVLDEVVWDESVLGMKVVLDENFWDEK